MSELVLSSSSSSSVEKKGGVWSIIDYFRNKLNSYLNKELLLDLDNLIHRINIFNEDTKNIYLNEVRKLLKDLESLKKISDTKSYSEMETELDTIEKAFQILLEKRLRLVYLKELFIKNQNRIRFLLNTIPGTEDLQLFLFPQINRESLEKIISLDVKQTSLEHLELLFEESEEFIRKNL